MRWLFLKDLQILRRSPLLVALLVLYPIIIATLIGFAISRGPSKPRVAFLNEVPAAAGKLDLGGQSIDVSRYADEIFSRIEPVQVSSEKEALDKVRSGDVLGALIIPPDITQKLETGLESANVKVFFNSEDPVKYRFVQDTIKSEVQDANAALTKQLTKVALGYLDLISKGGDVSLFGSHFNVLGLEKAEAIVRAAQASLPANAPEREQLAQVATFAKLARDNLKLSGGVLQSVGTPIKVQQTIVKGGHTPLDSFAVAIAVTVSLMFVTLLLASGVLALEREENAFLRLVRGLVSRTGLLVEKVGLAAVCAIGVSLVMLAGIALFVSLEWGRFPLWLLGLAFGALAFGAMGVAIGGVTREVRAASLLAFMVSLPIAFLALVPSGSVSEGLYDVIRVISALFPFKPTLEAMNSALNRSGGIVGPLVHLAILTLAFGVIARISLRRFA
ncbi:MAG TPA: ABC transporter permease [Thermoleophilaceae bacterium]|nr:ABC transporter permease [Thermoleophilaceae bacterium]